MSEQTPRYVIWEFKKTKPTTSISSSATQRAKVAEGANTPPWDREYSAPTHYVKDRSISAQDYTKHAPNGHFFKSENSLKWMISNAALETRGLLLRRKYYLGLVFFLARGRKYHWLNLFRASDPLHQHKSPFLKIAVFTQKTRGIEK